MSCCVIDRDPCQKIYGEEVPWFGTISCQSQPFLFDERWNHVHIGQVVVFQFDRWYNMTPHVCTIRLYFCARQSALWGWLVCAPSVECGTVSCFSTTLALCTISYFQLLWSWVVSWRVLFSKSWIIKRFGTMVKNSATHVPSFSNAPRTKNMQATLLLCLDFSV